VSIMFIIVSFIIWQLCYCICLQLKNCRPLWATWVESLCYTSNECQWRVANFGCCIMYNWRAVQWRLHIIEVLSVCMGNMLSIDIATPKNEFQQSVNRAWTECELSVNRASTERQ
jgi:hypothetical protein